MPSSFQSPRNPLAALWASAVETYLRKEHPDLSVQKVRQLPMMKGVYEHLSQLSEKQKVTKPSTKQSSDRVDESLQVAQMAYLSQSFLNLAVTTAGFTSLDTEMYEEYISLLNSYNASHDIGDFSTDDIIGFALCLIIWVGLAGLDAITTTERYLLDYLVDLLPLTSAQKQQIQDFWNSIDKNAFSPQYRDAAEHPNYQAIPWKIPSGAQIVMLGDWGTALDDAHDFLYAIWKKAFQNNPNAPVVFLHLGDIYYCGLPYECQNYFYDVFVNVGAQLQSDLGDSRFDPNPPIFAIPGNHEYYSFGYGYYQLLDTLNKNVSNISHADLYQQCSFFCLRTEDNKWQFLGMDTGQADGNGLLSALQGAGDAVKGWFDSFLPDWGWLEWVEGLASSTYEDFVGPFQPTLKTNERKWLQDRMTTFSGKTIMLSHHQLFSREAKINHNNPEYMNTWLDSNFSAYYKNYIAAWYWGHEHTFAVYQDGLMGLNKGRLLGSSSYEATEENDTPYANNYPMVPFAANMTDDLVHKNSDGLYYHVGAIMSQSGSDMTVKYYQFPAWTQLDTTPSNLQLEEITEVAEHITTSFTSLKQSWIGNKPINKDVVTTDHSPAITTYNDMLYLLYADGVNNNGKLTISTANAANYKPESTSSELNWTSPAHISVSNSNITPVKAPALIAVNGVLYGFYICQNSYLHGIITTATNGTPTNWTSINHSTNHVGAKTPGVCFFQGRIYFVYRESGSDNNLCIGYYDIVNNSWHDFGKLYDNTGDNIESDGTPALATDAYHIYMTYQEKGGTKVKWAVATPSSTVPDGTSNNLSWSKKGTVTTPDDDGSGTKNPDTDTGLDLQYNNGVFYLTYASQKNNLKQYVLVNTSDVSTGNWIGSSKVEIGANTSKSSVAKTSKAPALAITSGGGFLVYRGNSHDEIYQSYY